GASGAAAAGGRRHPGIGGVLGGGVSSAPDWSGTARNADGFRAEDVAGLLGAGGGRPTRSAGGGGARHQRWHGLRGEVPSPGPLTAGTGRSAQLTFSCK